MPTKRWLTTVVCSGRSLVAAGGVGEGRKKTEYCRSDGHRDPTMDSQQPPTPTVPSISNTLWRPGLHAGRSLSE